MNIFTKETIKILDDIDDDNFNWNQVQIIRSRFESPRKDAKIIIISFDADPGHTREYILPKIDGEEGKDFFLGYKTSKLTESGKWLISGVSEKSSYVLSRIITPLDGEKTVIVSSTESAEIANLFIDSFAGDKLMYLCDLKNLCKKFNVDVWEIFNSI